MKKVLIIHGLAKKESLTENLALAYKNGATDAGATVEHIDLSEMEFYYE